MEAAVSDLDPVLQGADPGADLEILVIGDHASLGLDAELDEHLQAIFDFSARLSPTPPEATKADAQALADVGLSELESIDLVFSSAIFGWANRLMHTLGEPVTD